jgi:mono/diheme cytochrome c family protein
MRWGRVGAALGLCGVLLTATRGQTASRSTWDGVYTNAQAKRGAALYAQECTACHGAQLGGVDEAPALVGGRFASNWDGVPLSAMVERIRVSMPQSSPGKLSRRQVADVLAYILERNGFPAGTMELPRQAGLLQGIVYKARKGAAPRG